MSQQTDYRCPTCGSRRLTMVEITAKWDGFSQSWKPDFVPLSTIICDDCDECTTAERAEVKLPPAPWRCQVCGQDINDGQPCGCGARR